MAENLRLRHPVESPPSASTSLSPRALLDEDATWRTKYSYSSGDEYEYPSGYSPAPGSAYAWDINKIRPARSLSTISVMTAEPIDYDCSKEIDFKPSQESVSQCSSQCLSSTSSSIGCSSYNASTAMTAPKQLLPGNPKLLSGDHKSHFNLCDVVAVESAIHQIRSQKDDPPSFYHYMELNPGPVDMVPRLSNVPSQYQLQDMYEFSAFQTSDAMAKLCRHERSYHPTAAATNGDEAFKFNGGDSIAENLGPGGDAETTLGQVDSEYYTEA